MYMPAWPSGSAECLRLGRWLQTENELSVACTNEAGSGAEDVTGETAFIAEAGTPQVANGVSFALGASELVPARLTVGMLVSDSGGWIMPSEPKPYKNII